MVTDRIVIEYDPKEYPHIHLVVASDQHFGSAEFNIRCYRQFLKENLSLPNSYLITVGDGLDCITTRDKRFRMGGVDPRYLVSNRPDEILDHQVEHFIEEHLPYRDKILGLGMGNHESMTLQHYNTNVHRQICRALEARNLGYVFMLNLVLRPKGANGRSRTFKVMGCHGFGGASRAEGGALSSYANFAKHYDVDAAFLGHKHDFVYKRIPKVGIKNDASASVDYRDFILALTGTFKETFGRGDVPVWEETMGFVPRVPRGGWNLRLTPEHDGWIRTKMSEG